MLYALNIHIQGSCSWTHGYWLDNKLAESNLGFLEKMKQQGKMTRFEMLEVNELRYGLKVDENGILVKIV